MRIFLKIILTLVAIISFVIILFGAGVYAYGQYGVPLVNQQIDAMEQQIEDDLNEEYPGSQSEVDISEIFYSFQDTSLYSALKIDSATTVAGTITDERTTYVTFDVMKVVLGSTDYEKYEESERADAGANYKEAPALLTDEVEAKKVGLIYLIVSAVVFVLSILVNALFLRKKKRI
jgi:hypothetical protein